MRSTVVQANRGGGGGGGGGGGVSQYIHRAKREYNQLVTQDDTKCMLKVLRVGCDHNHMAYAICAVE